MSDILNLTTERGPGTCSLQVASELYKLVDRLGCKTMTERQSAALVEAGAIVDRVLAYKPVAAAPGCGLAAWLRSDSTGLSSRYMARVLAPAGMVPPESNGCNRGIRYPLDPQDFVRCWKLLRAVPAFRPRVWELAHGHGPVWAAYAANWSRMEALWRIERRNKDKTAPELYRLMQELQKDAQETHAHG